MFIRHPYFEIGADGGGGTPPAPTEQQEFETLSAKDPATLTPEEKTKFEGLQAKYQVVEKDADGNILTPEKKQELVELQNKLEAIAAKDVKDRTKEEQELFEKYEDKPTFTVADLYKKVDELAEFEYEIEYGDVKPDSPEGILLRENVIRDVAVQEYVEQMRATMPRAYEFLTHIANGGKEEEFFAIQNKDFLNVVIDKNDKGAQESILRTALQIKGNSPEQIDAVVTYFKDNGKLLEQANKELEALQNNQKAVKAKEERDAAEAAKAERAAKQEMYTSIQNSIVSGFDTVVVPKDEQAAFTKFVAGRVYYDKGGFVVKKNLDAKELAKELKVAYFEFKGGDLKSLAERTAATKQAAKFKSLIVRDVVPKGNGATAGSGKMTLAEV